MGDEIIKVLDKIGEQFGVAIDWSSANVMPYLQDLLARYTNYLFYSSIVYLVVAIAMLTVGILLFKHAYKLYKENKDCFITGGLAILLCFMGFMGAMDRTLAIIELKTVPERAIIREIKTELNNHDD